MSMDENWRHEKMIQLYAKLSDLTPIENYNHPNVQKMMNRFFEDIVVSGVKTSLHVNRFGSVMNGCARRRALIKLGAKFAPIDFQYLLGLMYEPNIEMITLRDCILPEIQNHWKSSKPLITSTKDLTHTKFDVRRWVREGRKI